MKKKYMLFLIMGWLIFQPFEPLFASLSTHVRVTAVKGIVTTELVKSKYDSKLLCPLERKLNIAESRIINAAARIKTGNDSYAQIEYSDHSMIKLAPNTEVVLEQNNIYIKEGYSWFKVEKQKDGTLIVKTPTAIAGIRGTEFTMEVQKDGKTTCRMINGSIEISDAKEKSKMILSSGLEVTIRTGSSILVPGILNIKNEGKWWADWPKLVPLADKPSNQQVGINSDFSNAVSDPCGYDVAFVRSLYRSILGRDLDVSYAPGHGVAHLRDLQNGYSRWKVIMNFFNSPEYKNKHKSHQEFIRDVYQAVLGREPKANEISLWPQMDRSEIVRKFINSDEYRKLMADCLDNRTTSSSPSLAGTWNLNQDNGYKGVMNLQQGQGDSFTGNVIWNGYLKGTINGKIVENTINFTIDYHNGDIGNYKGTLSQDGIKISNGTTNGNNGVFARWSASKAVVPSSKNQNLKSQPWILGTDNHVYHGTKSGWTQPQVGSIGKDIATDANGRPWIIGNDLRIYHLKDSKWIEYPGNGLGIAISVAPDGTPWVIGSNNHIFHGTATSWVEQPGGGIGKDIAVDGRGRPWVIGSNNTIWYHNGSQWVEYPGGGRGIAISVSSGGIPWIIGMDNHVYYNTGAGWIEQAGGIRGKDIAVDAAGRPWIIGYDNGIYYYNGVKWVQHAGRGKGFNISVIQ